MPSSSSATPRCARRPRSDRCPRSAWSRSSAAPTAASTRPWPRGTIDEVRLRELLVEHRPKDWPLVFAVDASTWDRCDAECSPERGFHYSASKHSAGQPIVAGWSYQWICQLNWAPDSWTAPLDALRIHRRWTGHHRHHRTGRSVSSPCCPTTARCPAVRLRRRLRPHRPRPRAGRHPGAGAGAHRLDPGLPPRSRAPHDRGRGPSATPRTPLQCSRTEATWPTPDSELTTTDPRYGKVKVTRLARPASEAPWSGALARLRRTADRQRQRHPRRGRTPAQADGTDQKDAVAVVVRRRRARPRPVLAGLPAPVRHRAHLPVRERNTLGWTTPSLQMPEQADRWTWLVARRLHPAPSRSSARRRPPTALGTDDANRAS